jgi:uncharacterized DUF497 family protein
MQVVCDPDKNAENRRKHGISLPEAARMDWDAALVWQDTRRDYGETRMVALGAIGDRLYCAVYVDRGTDRRIVSLRKANRREFDRYEQETN